MTQTDGDRRALCRLLVLCALLTNCASPQKDFAEAQKTGTIAAYEEIVLKHPNSMEAMLARQRIAHDRAWQDAVERNTAATYRDFLARYPKSLKAEEARRRLAPLELAEDWANTMQADSVDAYETFVRRYPRESVTEEARSRLGKALVREAETQWEAVGSTSDAEKLEAYIRRFPRSPHVAQAKRLLEDARTPEDPGLLEKLRAAAASAARPGSVTVLPGQIADGLLVRAEGSTLIYERGRIDAPGTVFARTPLNGASWIPVSSVNFLLLTFWAPNRAPERVVGHCNVTVEAIPYVLAAGERLTLIVPREVLPCEVELKGVVRGRIGLPK